MSGTPARYQGKPLLRLLECYVLKVIGGLSASETANLVALRPKLAQLYGVQGTWDEIIAVTMKLPSNLPQLIVGMWDRNQGIAKANGVTLSPQQFAEMFVDQNLAPPAE